MAPKKDEVQPQGDAPATDEPKPPELGAALKQLAILPVMWLSGKIDFTDEFNVQLLRIFFAVMMGSGYIALTFAISKVKRLNDGSRVRNPGSSQYLKDEDKADDGSVSVRTYDNAKLQEAKMQFVMSACIGCFMHFKFGYTQPLILMSIMQPMQLFDNKAIAIHLRGKSGPDYERPFKVEKSGNPLQDWAEKKKAEAEAAQAAAKHAKTD